MTLYNRIKTLIFGEDAPVVPSKPETCYICGKTLKIGQSVAFIIRDIAINETNTTTYLAYVHCHCLDSVEADEYSIEEVNERLTTLRGGIADDQDKLHFEWLVERIITEIKTSEIAMGGRT